MYLYMLTVYLMSGQTHLAQRTSRTVTTRAVSWAVATWALSGAASSWASGAAAGRRHACPAKLPSCWLKFTQKMQQILQVCEWILMKIVFFTSFVLLMLSSFLLHILYSVCVFDDCIVGQPANMYIYICVCIYIYIYVHIYIYTSLYIISSYTVDHT